MREAVKMKCPWCERENIPKVSKEESDYADIVVRRCSACENVLASYLDEKKTVLKSVRTFPD
jgi:uncharacterized Zn finger protein